MKESLLRVEPLAVLAHELRNPIQHGQLTYLSCYTPTFGRIRLSLERIGSCVIFTVEDNGVGIATDRLPFVFDLFTRADSDCEPSMRGLGVGLALVREIAILHGGEVCAQSHGRGSEFSVRLPICAPSLLVELR
jgi:signal transduction histidine kinase